jgi:hypothetical protein
MRLADEVKIIGGTTSAPLLPGASTLPLSDKAEEAPSLAAGVVR